MSSDDFTPITKQSSDAFERALLRAGQRERAPEGAEGRILESLGLAGPGSGTVAMGSLSTWARTWGPKGLLVSATIVVAGFGFKLIDHRKPPSPSVEQRSESVHVAEAVPVAAPTLAEPAAPVVPSSRVEDLPAVPSAKPVATTSARTAANRPALADESEPSLAREVELLAGARSALMGGDAPRAMGILDTHDREFASGTLMPESQVLRIEALVQAGGNERLARAGELAKAFLSVHPKGPQARRVRAVQERIQASTNP
ncbi:hypothetical protein AKJ09_10681 [Labilithrix luteola]|uniref:Outer membrane lipoprotein BamD-like domain-containing protein n=1 Tax=Labilithrix luteola TaxID=1391654 RepID=A0A0K1QE65_9BACT|nr:hypothetical protein [Labilithrix luteola]AKV04018.1 hypothetical protein AKJ09_10681 [Labilithrix luteola]